MKRIRTLAALCLPLLSASLFACSVGPVDGEEQTEAIEEALVAEEGDELSDEEVIENLSGLAQSSGEEDSMADAEGGVCEQLEFDPLCKAKVEVKKGNPPGYLDVKHVTSRGWDGDCLLQKPCYFDLDVLIRSNAAPWDPQSMVGIVFGGQVITQTPNGMAGKWNKVPLACGEELDFSIMSYREDVGLSKIADISWKCAQCVGCGATADVIE